MRPGPSRADGQVRGRRVFLPEEDLSAARNRKVEAINHVLDSSSKSERGPKGSAEDTGNLLQVLAADLNGVDLKLRKVQERSRDFVQAAEERIASKQALAARWEPFRPLSCGPSAGSNASAGPKPPATPRSGASGGMGGGGGAGGGGSALAAFGSAPVQVAEAIETNQQERRKPSKGRATAGPKLKALNALEECPYIANVHNVLEVQQIPCGTARVDTKVDYYREHDLAAGPLMEQVERRFMIYKGEAGEPLVNVPRLGKLTFGASAVRQHFAEPRAGASTAWSHRSDRSGYESRVGTAGGAAFRSERGDSRNSMRSPLPSSRDQASPSSPRRSPSPRFFTHEEHSARSERAVVSARQKQMDQRIEHLRLFQQRQARHERAARARPWFTWIVAAVAMEKARELVKAYQAELKHATFQATRPIYTGEESWNKVRRKLRILRSFSKSMAAAADIPRFKLITASEVITIKRLATQKGLEFADTRRRDKIWRLWMHAVRVAIFAVRVRSPLRKHIQMEITKKFINAAWKGYRILKTMKAYVRKVTLIKVAMKQTLMVMMIIKRNVILPQVWIAETLALGEAVGLKADCLQATVEDFEEAVQIAHWRAEAQRIMQNRSDIIAGKVHLRCASAAVQPPAGSGKKHGEAHHTSGKAHRVHEAHRGSQRKGAKHGRDSDPDVAHSRGGAAASTGKEHGRAAVKSQPEKHCNIVEVPGGGWTVENSVVRFVDEYRLNQEERELIAAQIWRENLERWWQVYKLYKDACKARSVRWRQWLTEASRLGPGHRELWPHEPSVQHFPMELMEVHIDALRQRVVGRLRQGKAAAIL